MKYPPWIYLWTLLWISFNETVCSWQKKKQMFDTRNFFPPSRCGCRPPVWFSKLGWGEFALCVYTNLVGGGATRFTLLILLAHTSCQLPDQICCTSGRADPSWVASHTIILHLYFIRYNWKIVAIWLMAMWSVLMVLVCLRTISIPFVGWRKDTWGEIFLNGGTLRRGESF